MFGIATAITRPGSLKHNYDTADRMLLSNSQFTQNHIMQSYGRMKTLRAKINKSINKEKH